MSSLLIIGGSGFFGKSFIDYFDQKTFDVWGIDKIYITSRSKQNIGNHNTIIYDLVNYSNLPETDYIIYAASTNNESVYKNSFIEEMDEQKKGMENFYKQVSGFKTPPKKILYTSSGAVYGQKNLNNKNTNEVTNSCNPDDNNDIKKAYANIKVTWENFLIKKLPETSVIARCFAFLGPRLPLNKHFAIGNFIGDYINRKNIHIKSSSSVYRSYMYCEDLVEWLLTILINSNPSKFNIINVGSPDEIEIHDLANIFNKISGREEIEFLIDCNEIDRYVPNISLAKKLYNLDLKFNLEDSIIKTIKFHRHEKN